MEIPKRSTLQLSQMLEGFLNLSSMRLSFILKKMKDKHQNQTNKAYSNSIVEIAKKPSSQKK